MIYRLKNAVETKDEELKPGALCYSTTHSQPFKIYVTSQPSGYGYSTLVTAADVDQQPEIKAKDFAQYLQYLTSGRGPELPNAKPVDDVEQALSNLAAGGSVGSLGSASNVKLPGDQHSRWARVFIDHTQMGGPSGRGTAIVYRRGIWVAPVGDEPGRTALEDVAPIWTFAICQHAPVEGAGARHERGWHPSSCPKCGLNLSVDSSD